jgi:NAD(P)-dependent dehydrogenase (short-subunit alcohol dehydrogenase family)
MDPAGRHALVTGGGSGIGAAIAVALRDAGAVVTVVGRRVSDAAGYQQADVTDGASIRAAVAAAEAAHGPIAILVNNAGAVESAPFARTSRAIWDRMLAVNLTGTFEVTQALLPAMVARGWGRVINVASTAGLTGYPYVAAYVAAKHGVVGLTRALALETAKSQVTVNAVCPGYTETALLTDSFAAIMAKTEKTEAEVRRDFTKSNPQGRLVQPEEVAAAVLWLCRPGSGAVTGQAIAIAGGEVLH